MTTLTKRLSHRPTRASHVLPLDPFVIPEAAESLAAPQDPNRAHLCFGLGQLGPLEILRCCSTAPTSQWEHPFRMEYWDLWSSWY